MKLSGAGFRAGTRVKIVFDAPHHVVVGSAVTRPDGTFKTSIVVPASGPGKHRLQVEGTAASGQPTSVEPTVVVLADEAVLSSSGTPGLAAPVLLTVSITVPLATWLALEMLGWRQRRLGKHSGRT